ncbi:hypothetical protein RND81_10G232900 [Saponaria officinalis]|uniref:Pentatricopeptide repeat-containing protein n=1 Tax=Saponaria officinalis TaxID=3572 RepID=A0AAW1I5M3_SAPOF
MNRAKLLRLSIGLATSLSSTRLNSFCLTQVTCFSQLIQFSPFSPHTNPHPRFKNPNLHQNLFSSSNSDSFIDFISSNDFSEEIEIELQKMDPKLTHESIVYVLLKLSKNPQKCLNFFKWVCVRNEFHVSYVHYTILLKSLVCREFLDNFWEIALEMQEKGFYIDKQVFLHVITNLKREKLDKTATEWTRFHKSLCKDFARNDVVKYVVDLIMEFGWGEEVKEKLSKKLKFPLSENFMIRVLRDLWKQPLSALKFFEWVDGCDGFVLNSVTYNAMLKVLAQPESINEFWELLGRMRDDGFEVDLDSYLKITRLGRLPTMDAVKFFELMMTGPYKPSLHECSSILKSILHDRTPDMELAYRAVNKYVDTGNALSKRVYDGIHRILCKLGKLDEAKTIVREMRIAGFEPDNITYSQEIFGLCTQKRFKDACNVLDEMEEQGCIPDIKTWTILIQGFCAAKQVDRALSCFFKMVEKNVNPDPEMLEVLLHGFLSEDRVFGGYRFLVEMVKKGRVKPWRTSYKLMIDKLTEVGKVEEALDLVKIMKKQGYSPFPDPIVRYVAKVGTVENAKKVVWAQCVPGAPSSAAYVWMIKSFMEEGRESEAKNLVYRSPKRVRCQKTIRKLFEETGFGTKEKATLKDDVH